MTPITPVTGSRRATRGDVGGVVNTFLIKLTLTLGLLGVLAFDAVSVGASRLAIQDQAVAAARAASENWQDSGSARAAYLAAQVSAADADPSNVVDPSTFLVAADGRVGLDLHRTARTFLARLLAPHVPVVEGWTTLHAHAESAPG